MTVDRFSKYWPYLPVDGRVGCDRIVKKRSRITPGHWFKYFCGNPGRIKMPNGEVLCRMHNKLEMKGV